MLADTQSDVCLSCHGSRGKFDDKVTKGLVSPVAQPSFLDDVLSMPFIHPLSPEAFSRHEPGVVTCTSCHSPHRGTIPGRASDTPSGRKYLSPRNPERFEHELCEDCHGSEGATAQSFTDISRLLSPSSRSFHPVHAPASEPSQSVIPALAGAEINCTDCHGNSQANGVRGPHGSSIRYILRRDYTTTDGGSESQSTYALCYSCHRREHLLEQSPFPEHEEHVVEASASCATCHNPHGSVSNRALIRFGEETTVGGVSPSASTGRLEFVSDGPGSGACYLTCHGVDHAPEAYGIMELRIRANRLGPLLAPQSSTRTSAPKPSKPKIKKQ
jgi:predicted CXXCH cytochrome family protein